MLILLLFCFILLIAIGVYLKTKWRKFVNKYNYDTEELGCVIYVLGTILSIITFICIISSAYEVSKLFIIDQKIEMYQEENDKIEKQIDVLVTNYMEYESKTYKEFKNETEDSITMVSLYPELKSDTLIQEQIKIYTTNNEKIKELKENKINGSVNKWWLYFGK